MADENLENIIYALKWVGAAVAMGLATMSIYATSAANKKFDMLKKEFIAASIASNDKALDDIVAERKKIERQYGCLPQSWTKHKSYPLDFSGPTICFKYQK